MVEDVARPPSMSFDKLTFPRALAWERVRASSPLRLELQGHEFVVEQHYWRKAHDETSWVWFPAMARSVDFSGHPPKGFVVPEGWSWMVWNDVVTGQTYSGLHKR